MFICVCYNCVKIERGIVMEKNKNEVIVRNVLIGLTIISLIITILNFTYQVYEDLNIIRINDFLVNCVNTWIMWIDNILLYIFAVMYIILGVKSKNEVVLKVSFSLFSILTAIMSLTFIVNVFARLFGIFD